MTRESCGHVEPSDEWLHLSPVREDAQPHSTSLSD